MIGQIFGDIVQFIVGAVSAGSTITDGGLEFIQAGSTGAEGGAGAVIGSLGNIFG